MRDPSRADGGNGHRRRQLRTRVLAEETHCRLCGNRVDKQLKYPHDMSAVIDENNPRSKGGSPYERSNCSLMHKRCNEYKGAMTLHEALTKWNEQEDKRQTPTPSPIW